MRRLSATVLFIVLAGAVGCKSGRFPVTGRVTYEDGSPVTEGNVLGLMGEGMESVSVQGNISSDGSFSWGLAKPGDGAPPGKYRVAIIPRGLGDSERAAGMVDAVAGKYQNPQTSGIEFVVKAEGKNELNIKIPKPKGVK